MRMVLHILLNNMGKQKKLKAQRREIRERRRLEEQDKLKKHQVSPPDLGFAVSERIIIEDKFGG